jgi:hypothetical protein
MHGHQKITWVKLALRSANKNWLLLNTSYFKWLNKPKKLKFLAQV